MRVGIIGVGTIGGFLAKRIQDDNSLSLAFVFDTDESKVKRFPRNLVVHSLQQALEKKADLVVETASQQAVVDYAPQVLAKRDLLILSVSALSFPKTEKAMRNACKKSGKRLFVPSGAILGIDGIHALRSRLKSVELSTEKPPSSLGREDSKRATVFSGSARKACRLFPKNVNISATLSLNGIGFDKTRVKVVSDPALKANVHTVKAEGGFGNILVRVAGKPSKNPKTSSTTAFSAFDMVKRVQQGSNLF